MNMPILFEFESQPVRVLTGDDNEPWFCAKDICVVLGYRNDSDAVKKHCREAGVAKRDLSSGGQMREMAFLNEGNLYRLIIKSRKEEAKRFESWVCDEVLPSIRKTGSYQMGNKPNVTQQVTLSRHRLSLLKELHRTRDRTLRAAIHEQLAHTSRSLGLSVPELDSIGWAEPEVPDILAEFWDALEQLDEKGVRYNHSLNAQLIALRLPQLRELFAQYSIRMEITGDLRNALRQSRSPLYLDLKAVHSAIDGGTRKCWVFQR